VRVALISTMPFALVACASESENAYQEALDCHEATLSFNLMGDDDKLRASDPSKFGDSDDITAMWKAKVEVVGKEIGKTEDEVEYDISRNFGDVMTSTRGMSPEEIAEVTEQEFGKALKCTEQL